MRDSSDVQPGDRISLVFTADPYTRLRRGDIGTVKRRWKNLDSDMIDVDWDSGSNLALILGVDRFVIVEEASG